MLLANCGSSEGLWHALQSMYTLDDFQQTQTVGS